jgi:hypothetical protein
MIPITDHNRQKGARRFHPTEIGVGITPRLPVLLATGNGMQYMLGMDIAELFLGFLD